MVAEAHSRTHHLKPHFVTGTVFDIDATGNHRWWPICPSADASVEFDHDMPGWQGQGYLDCSETGSLDGIHAMGLGTRRV
ncbi:MAG: hypothetical protein R3D34_09175 [Nitratireductor sp.]